MKIKRILSGVTAIAFLVCIAGCGEKDTADVNNTGINGTEHMINTETATNITEIVDDTDTSNREITAEEYWKTLETNANVYKKYITVPNYSEMSVEVDKSILEVTNEEVKEYIQQEILNSYATIQTVTTGVTKTGDVITLDYCGKLNDVAFPGGTSVDVEYTIGSGKFISDLDKGLVGLTLGQKYDISCTYPKDYSEPELAGRDVVFTVKVKAIKKKIVPELTDQWVAANAKELGTTETTVEGIEKISREYLVEVAKVDYAVAKFTAALSKILEQVKLSSYPKKELEALKATYKTNVEANYNKVSIYYSELGINDFYTYLYEEYGCGDPDSFDIYAEDQAKAYLLEKMVVTIIAADNNVKVTADEIKRLGTEYAEYYEMGNYDELLKEYGKMLNAELGYAIVSEKVMEIVNKAVTEN